jgi:CRP-like cAMP-binding protein
MIEELRRIDLFDGLSDAELEPWCAITEIRDVEDGERLLEQGDTTPGPLLLFEGRTRQYVDANGRIDPMKPNEAPTWIAAIAAITDSPVPLNVDADGPCRVAVLPRAPFIELARAQPTVHRKVMQVIGPVMRGMNAREASRERLTSLGTMAAGLAHELNNPAAAARRAASDLVDAVEFF